MKKLLTTLYKNTLSQILLLLTVMYISYFLSRWFESLYSVSIIASVILLVYALVFIIAGIINAIKDGLK